MCPLYGKTVAEVVKLKTDRDEFGIRLHDQIFALLTWTTVCVYAGQKI